RKYELFLAIRAYNAPYTAKNGQSFPHFVEKTDRFDKKSSLGSTLVAFYLNYFLNPLRPKGLSHIFGSILVTSRKT
ncbi:hypothetical protein AAAT94_02620, partial [Intestinimonas aquisgranensis]